MRRFLSILLICLLWTDPASAAIAWISAAYANPANQANSYTMTIPTVLVDDLLILTTTNRTSTAPNDPTDNDSGGNAWAQVSGCNANYSLLYASTYWKRATSATSAKTITHTGFTNSVAPVLHVYRGAKTTGTPIELCTYEGNATSDTTMTTTITPNQANSMILLTAFWSAVTGLDNAAATSPATLPEASEGTSSAGAGTAVMQLYGLQTTATSVGSVTWTQRFAAENMLTTLMAIIPVGSAVCVSKLSLLGVGSC